MNEPSMRDALLGQSGPACPQSSPRLVLELMEAENRRAWRLTLAALAVWTSWLFVLALGFGLYLLLPEVPETSITPYIVLVVVGMFFVGAPLLPIIAAVLTILAVLTRRSATVTQLRASLAAIEAQLKELAAAQKPPTG